MICSACTRELQGGFLQKDGTHRCAACIIATMNAERLRECLSQIIAITQTEPDRSAKRSRHTLARIRSWAEFALGAVK